MCGKTISHVSLLGVQYCELLYSSVPNHCTHLWCVWCCVVPTRYCVHFGTKTRKPFPTQRVFNVVCVWCPPRSCRTRSGGGSSSWRRSANGRLRTGPNRRRRDAGERRSVPGERPRRRYTRPVVQEQRDIWTRTCQYDSVSWEGLTWWFKVAE